MPNYTTRVYVAQDGLAADQGREEWVAYYYNTADVLAAVRGSLTPIDEALAHNQRRIDLARGTRADCLAAAERYVAGHAGAWVSAEAAPRWPITPRQ